MPISEFKAYDKPMLLADLPYAHETAAGAKEVAFFDPDQPLALASLMNDLINGDTSFLQKVESLKINEPMVDDWKGMFQILLDDRTGKNNK